MLNNLVIILVLFVVTIGYLVFLFFFFKKKNKKDIFSKIYFITGCIIGLIYILFNIFIPFISQPVVSYMEIIDYSDNALKTAEDIKEILTNKDLHASLSEIIENKQKNNNLTAINKLEAIENKLNNLLKAPLTNFKFKNLEETLDIINNIASYEGLEYIGKIIKSSKEPRNLLEEISSARNNDVIVKSLDEYIMLIDNNLSEIIYHSDNNLNEEVDLKCINLFDFNNENTLTKLYNSAVDTLKNGVKEMKSSLNNDYIINYVLKESDIQIIEKLENVKNEIGEISKTNNVLKKLDKNIRDRVAEYIIKRNRELRDLFNKEIIKYVKSNKTLKPYLKEIKKELEVIHIDYDALAEADSNYKIKHIKVIYSVEPWAYIYFEDLFKSSNGSLRFDVKKIMNSVKAPITINIDRIINYRLSNIIAINNIKLGLLQIKNVIKNTKVVEALNSIKLSSLVEGINMIKKVYIYYNTSILISYLNEYSINPIDSLNKIEKLYNNEEIKETIQDEIYEYIDIEEIFSLKPNYDMDEMIFDSLSEELKIKYRNAMADSIFLVSEKLKQDKDYELFSESLIVINKNNLKTLVVNNEENILSAIVETGLSYRPVYPFLAKDNIKDVNKLLKQSVLNDIKKKLSSKNPKIPKKQIVFISGEFKEKIYNEAIQSAKETVELLKDLTVSTEDIDLDTRYKTMLSKNLDFEMPSALKIEIIEHINPLLFEELKLTVENMKENYVEYLPMDISDEKHTEVIISYISTLLNNKNLTSVSDKIISMGMDDPLLQKDTILIKEKTNRIGKNYSLLQSKVASSYNSFGSNLFNTILGLIMSILMWPLVAVVLLSGLFFVPYMNFLIFHFVLTIVFIVIGLVVLIMPYVLSYLPIFKHKES